MVWLAILLALAQLALLCGCLCLCWFVFRSPPRSQHVPRENSSTEGVPHPPPKEPPTFDGEPGQFKEWLFAIDLALRSLAIEDEAVKVDYVAGFLVGNARLWIIFAVDSGKQFRTWSELKDALRTAFGPRHEEERARLHLFALRQGGSSVDSYIANFGRLSLQVLELDELSRALLFVQGLHPRLLGDVLSQHPTTLEEAVRATQVTHQFRSVGVTPNSHQPRFDDLRQRPTFSRSSQAQQRGEREPVVCYRCRKPGHLARTCNEGHPNAGSW